MPRKRRILAAAVPSAIGVLLLGAAAVRVMKQAALERSVEDLRSQATTQATNREFVHAADVKQAAIPWNLDCSLGGGDDPTVKLYRISATPSTWVIDRHGVVRYYDLRGEILRRAVAALVRES